MAYEYSGLAPLAGCAGCEWIRRSEVGPKNKERLMTTCLLAKRVPSWIERPACYQPQETTT